MAIVRLTLEVLQGQRENDTEEARTTAQEELRDFQQHLADSGLIYVYSEEERNGEPWGKEPPPTFFLDFDTVGPPEPSNAEVLAEVTGYLLGSPFTS